MSKLPIIQLPRGRHKFSDGSTIDIRGLSRAEALQIGALNGEAVAIECMAIQFGCNVSEDEAKEWHASQPQGDVEELVQHISTLSGLDADVGKADAEDSLSAKLTELISLLQKLLERP